MLDLSANTMIPRLLIVSVLSLARISPTSAQSPTPAGMPPRPEAIYTPMPVYRPEWAKQSLSGKGVVLITIDKATGAVSGAKMLESTGSQLLDGAALEAYSKWRFKPGSSATQVKMPIEFRPRPSATASRATPPANTLFILLIAIGIPVVLLAMRKRRG